MAKANRNRERGKCSVYQQPAESGARTHNNALPISRVYTLPLRRRQIRWPPVLTATAFTTSACTSQCGPRYSSVSVLALSAFHRCDKCDDVRGRVLRIPGMAAALRDLASE